MSGEILVTGFDRFGLLKRPNASSEVILPFLDSERSEKVKTLVLPTVFEGAIYELQQAADDINPSAIVMFGIAGSLKKVRLERQAHNMRLSSLRDNVGEIKLGRIVKDGPKKLTSTLPLTELYEDLSQADVPVKFSTSAGRFVCNNLFYQALYSGQIEGTLPDVPTGFVHVSNRMDEATLQRAASTIIDSLDSKPA